MRTDDQHSVSLVSNAELCNGLLSTGEEPDAAQHELEYRYLCGRNGTKLGLLSREGAI